jgi:hypothetical protein
MATPSIQPRQRQSAAAPDRAAAGDEIDREIAKRQARLLAFFPGDPERAAELAKTLDRLTGKILDYLVNAKEPDRSQMRRAVQAEIASFARPAGTPAKAPRLWSERDTSESITPVQFIRRHYSRWLRLGGLTRKDVHDLDPQLYRALSVWEHRHPEERINELPTLSEVIDEKIAALSAEFSEDELRKLGTTLQTRLRRTKK